MLEMQQTASRICRERNEPLFQTDIIQRYIATFYKKFDAPENHQEWRDKKLPTNQGRRLIYIPVLEIKHFE
jgi:hypothetical protein